MADPIEIIQTAMSVANKIYRTVKSIKDAPAEIQDLEREASRARGILGELVKDLEDRSDQDAVDWSLQPLRGSLEDARQLTEDVNTFLDKVLDTKTDGSHSVNKFNWLRYGSDGKIKEFVGRFDRFYLSLSTIQSTNNTSTARRLEKRITRQEVMLAAVHAAVQEPLYRAANEQRRGLNQLFDRVTTCSFPPPTTASITTSGDAAQSSGTLQDISTPDATAEDEAYPFANIRCQLNCPCRCHKRTIPIVPRQLIPWVGGLYVPPSLFSALASSSTPCDDPSCKRRQSDLFTIKYYLPSWFAEVTADIRLKVFPVHFCIRTQRVVKSLAYLNTDSLDDIRRKLSSRELTVNDVQPNGFTVLHQLVWRLSQDQKMGFTILSFFTEQSASQEWLFLGLTPLEYALQGVAMRWRAYGSRKAIVEAFQYNVGAYFHQDFNDAWESFAEKMCWTDLHKLAFALPSSPATTHGLKSIPPSLSRDINRPDLLGRTPLFYAIAASSASEPVELLLRAGARPDTEENNMLFWAVCAGADKAIGPLVRAGADVCRGAKRISMSILHLAAYPDITIYPNSLAVAYALVRHCGHLLDYDARDGQGQTPLDYAKRRMEQNAANEGSKRIFELLSSRRISKGSQYAQPWDATETDGDGEDTLPATSIIRAGLRGDIQAIGALIAQDAMVNERDHMGRTLLHLVALGDIQSGYNIASELIRHGGYGVDWDARSDEGITPLGYLERRLAHGLLDTVAREDAENVYRLLKARRLPANESYIFPCMDPDPHGTHEGDLRIPGGWS
ncbi:hypothetical protein NM688_g2812 [Phlebia brevispora]|uniref:Uncharacterized protein n=1 Tax=Phlebia brevispora TaxID=194682 RepID=A0ACC1T7I5_9APHY|nr:hypothetical protein NM688_g2812 [Phlebia brevispora]